MVARSAINWQAVALGRQPVADRPPYDSASEKPLSEIPRLWVIRRILFRVSVCKKEYQ